MITAWSATPGACGTCFTSFSRSTTGEPTRLGPYHACEILQDPESQRWFITSCCQSIGAIGLVGDWPPEILQESRRLSELARLFHTSSAASADDSSWRPLDALATKKCEISGLAVRLKRDRKLKRSYARIRESLSANH